MAARKPAPGFTWNPLTRFPRNGVCICGSGKKFKKCCLPGMPAAISDKQLESLRKK